MFSAEYGLRWSTISDVGVKVVTGQTLVIPLLVKLVKFWLVNKFLSTKIYADYVIIDQNFQILCFLLLFLASGSNFYRFLLKPTFLPIRYFPELDKKYFCEKLKISAWIR